MDNLRTPLSRVRRLGSAREGANRFLVQRLSAIALVPLLLWFVASIIFFIFRADHASLVAWIQSYWNTEILIFLIILLFYHAHSGLQEVLIDYVHHKFLKAIALVSITVFVIAITVASILAVLRIALGA